MAENIYAVVGIPFGISGLIVMLAESGLRQLSYENSQNELEKSQKYLNTIYNSVSDSIFIHDSYGNISDVNQPAIPDCNYWRTCCILL